MLNGRSAIVTGSTSGIGLAIARSLAGAGCNVMLHGFGDADEIETLRAYLEAEHGIRALYSTADMMRPGQIAAMVEEAAEFGGIDILVNNAGIQHVAPIEEFPAEKWNAILAVNLSSAFHTTRAVLPAMKARGWGRIINIASAHALVASPFKSAYVAAKHGLLGLTKVVALEAAESGVTCNAICPGYVLTPGRRSGAGPRNQRAGSHARRAPGGSADQGVRQTRGVGGPRGVLGKRCGGIDYRHGAPGRWRLDGAMSARARPGAGGVCCALACLARDGHVLSSAEV
jgi:3-hydroxybutyrate dehydrogenase